MKVVRPPSRWHGTSRVSLIAAIIVASAACTVVESPTASPSPSTTPPAVTPSPQPTLPVGDSWFMVPNVPEARAQVRAVSAGGLGWVAVGSACPPRQADCEGYVPAAWSSPDGYAWIRALGVPVDGYGEMTAVTSDGSMLYAAGTTSLTSGTVWRSADGLVWEVVGSGRLFDLGSCFEGCPGLGSVAAGTPGVVVSGGRIVVTGERVEVVPALWFSPDGSDWHVTEGARLGQDAATRVSIGDIVAGGPGFVTIGQVCDPRCRATTWTSSDGLDWSGPTDLSAGGEAMPLRIVAGGDRLVAIAERCPADEECTAVTTWSSTDARTWSEVALDGEPDSRLPGLLAESRGRFVALTAVSERITVWSSTDGTTWEQRGSEGLPPLGGREGVLELHVAAGLLGAFLIGEYETTEEVDTRAWISPGG